MPLILVPVFHVSRPCTSHEHTHTHTHTYTQKNACGSRAALNNTKIKNNIQKQICAPNEGRSTQK